jgi:Rad3-related DNA helicase
MIDDLATTIAKISTRVPGGILIFFPSYKVMNDIYERWTKSGGLHKIQMIKKVLKEPSNAAEYQIIIDRYYSSIYEDEDGKGGAILMGVCRGRISEGLDFSDNAARMVIIIGIPFP